MTTTSGTVTFHYNQSDNIIYETDQSGTVLVEYTWDHENRPVTMLKNGLTYYYHLNGHGDVVALTDKDGNNVASYTYDAWGNIINQSGTMYTTNPYRYAGYRFDDLTGLYYLMARYYDPNLGRFLTKDTFEGIKNNPQTLNKYAYVNNNPVMLTDHNGLLGKHWYNKRSHIATALNVALIIYTGGQTYFSAKALYALLKKSGRDLSRKVKAEVQKRLGSTVGNFVGTAFQVILEFAGQSLGGAIAAALDYADKYVGYSGYNGYILN